jgi:hypothetical protein
MKILISATLLTVAALVPLYGVMFASDEVTLTEDGVPITDNSVLMIDSRYPQRIEVVENGIFRAVQSPGPLVFELRRMKNPVTTWEEWKRSGRDGGKAYDDYLAGLSAKYSVTIELPEATDTSTSYSPPLGQEGGTIGTTRHFTADLKTGKVSLTGQVDSAVRTSHTQSGPIRHQR